MEKKVGFKLHKVKKNWVTIGVSTLSMVALAGGALLADQSAQADEVSLPNGDGFEQTDAGIESSASLINESYSPTLTEDAGHLSAVSSNYGSQTNSSYESSSSASTGGSSQTVVGGGSGQVSSSQSSQVVGTQNSNSSQTGSAYQSSSSSSSVSASASSSSSSSSSAWYSYSSSSSWSSSSSASGFATITTSSSDSNGIHWNGGRNTTITITASGTTPNVTIVSNSNKLFPNVTVGQSNGSNANVTIISQGNQQNNSGYQIITGETKPSVDSNNSKSSFVRVGENQWYYYDQYGQKVKGEKVIDGKSYYFLENGLQARDSLVKGSDGYTYYYDKNGVKAINGFYDFAGYRKDVRYFDCYGHMATGLIEMGGTTFYFDTQTGIQAKDKFIRFSDGRIRYFIPDTGNMAVNTFVQNKENQAWYYLDEHGYAVTGKRIINGKEYCFDSEGRQIKGQMMQQGNKHYYISAQTGEMAVSRFIFENNNWYYADAFGCLVQGAKVIDGKLYYFNKDHSQLKGGWAEGRYYDAVTGQAVINQFIQMAANQWAYLNQDGHKVTGLQNINNKVYYFGSNGAQVKGKLLTVQGKKCYFDAHTGEQVVNRFVEAGRGCWYYFNAAGQAVTGKQVINGKQLYFDGSGRQVKGRYVYVGGKRLFCDAKTGELRQRR
jgi:glucan-binding repeat-containing protein